MNATVISRLVALFPTCRVEALGDEQVKITRIARLPRYRSIDVADLDDALLATLDATASEDRWSVLIATLNARREAGLAAMLDDCIVVDSSY